MSRDTSSLRATCLYKDLPCRSTRIFLVDSKDKEVLHDGGRYSFSDLASSELSYRFSWKVPALLHFDFLWHFGEDGGSFEVPHGNDLLARLAGIYRLCSGQFNPS